MPATTHGRFNTRANPKDDFSGGKMPPKRVGTTRRNPGSRAEPKTYDTVILEQTGQVLTIRIRVKRPSIHWDLGEIFSEARGRDDVRVIVITGEEDGLFSAGPQTQAYQSDEALRRLSDPVWQWRAFTGIVRCHEAMAAIEKPIVSKVNGDAHGFASSLIFASDLVVARADAKIVDDHLAMGDVPPYGAPYGIVPGDGGAALVPLHMTPMRAKEYLMLAREYTGSELAAIGAINYAVPPEQLDAFVDEIVGRLLRRPAYALAWTKRLINRRIVEQLNLTLDAGVAYEMVGLNQVEGQRGVDKLTLE